MSKQFQTAEELMDYLKKQIVHYSNGEEFEFQESISISSTYQNSVLDLSRLSQERDANNVLWNVSAERPITSHRKLIGKVIVFSKKIMRKLLRWYVSQTFELQSAFNGSVTRSINEITNSLQTVALKLEEMEIQSIEQIKRIEATSKNNHLEKYEELIKKQSWKITELEAELEELKKLVHGNQNEELHANVHSLKESQESLFDKIQNVERYIKSIEDHNIAQFHQLNKEINFTHDLIKNETNFMNYRIRKLMKPRQQLSVDGTSRIEDLTLITNDKNVEADFDYLHFENKFRGSVDEIKNRQRSYLPYFVNSNNVLDIGCGRGEFIELMIENNISVNGIDLNEDMVEYCQDRGLPVTKNDAVKYLYSVEDGSLGGIFLGQVIEHMPFDQIIIMVELAYKKLKPGSHLIMETPNPLSLAIFYRTFYVDPTHVKPIHPLTIQYVVESVGFSKTEIQYSSSVEPNWWLPKLQGDPNNSIANIEEFNLGVERVNNLLYGHLDYAIIAKK